MIPQKLVEPPLTAFPNYRIFYSLLTRPVIIVIRSVKNKKVQSFACLISKVNLMHFYKIAFSCPICNLPNVQL